jgi:hypothetical protein
VPYTAGSLKPQLSDDAIAEPTLERAVEAMGTRPADYWTAGAAFFERLRKWGQTHLCGSMSAARAARAEPGRRKRRAATGPTSATFPGL